VVTVTDLPIDQRELAKKRFKNHTATILNYLTLTRKIQREWTLVT
jgi:hypothetical protein